MNQTVIKIENILRSKYDVSAFTDFIREIFPSVKIVAPDKFNKEYTNFSTHIEGSTHIGNYVDPDGKRMIIHSVQLKKESYVENSRSTQRSYAKKLIEAGNADAAIIAFYTIGDSKWRISFVRLDYEIKFENGKLNTKENMTPAKRYSYLVGEDEPCHTAISRFHNFIIDDPNIAQPTLNDLEEAFSVEKVTEEFFNLYCEKFHQLREALEDNRDFVIEAEHHNFTSAQFAKKLMGQIVFLYFLQKKGWLGVSAWPRELNEKEFKNAFFARGAKSRELIPRVYVKVAEDKYCLSGKALNEMSDDDERFLASCVKGQPWGTGSRKFMRTLFETSQKKHANFFDDYLEPLFYNALNVYRGEQGYDPALHCRIPFLSGGLFEPIDGYDWEHNDFAIPNEVFSNRKDENDKEADGILDIFDRFNFTMSEDEPMEREVAIDPEMLGKVFENLLDTNDRKSKGAFYTPREIVHYMCQETLISYLIKETGLQETDIRDFILLGDFMKDEDTAKDKRQGYNDMLISKDIYRIDNNGKVVVNRLKDIDNALANIRVVDPAVGSGAFPLGMLNEIVRARQNISAYMAITMSGNEIRLMYNNERSPYSLKLETIKNCIFAADIEPSAVDIAQLRLWLSLVIDDEINPNAQTLLDGHRNPLPLPNLECNIVCGNSLVDEFEGIPLINHSDLIANNTYGVQQNFYQSTYDAVLPSLLKAQDELFRCEDTVKKQELKNTIESLKDELVKAQMDSASQETWERYQIARRQASHPFVLWQIDFARVFNEKGGFDAVIGNPPYVRVQSLSHELIDLYKKKYLTAWKRIDMSILFIELGYSLLKDCGNMYLISSNQFITTEYGRKMRNFLINHKAVTKMLDFGDLRVFENAMTYVSILGFSKEPNEYFLYSKIKNLPFIRPESYDSIRISSLSDEVWSLGSDEIESVLKKIKTAADYILNDIAKPSYGIVTGKDEFLLFDIDDSVDIEKDLLLPVIRAQGCTKFGHAKPSKKVLYPYRQNGDSTELIPLEILKEHYPRAYNYINSISNELKLRKDSRNVFGDKIGWYGLVRFGQLNIFNKEKIVTPGEVKHNKFGIDSSHSGFAGARVFAITIDDPIIDIRYILGILNSKVVEFFMHHIASLKSGGYYSYSTAVLAKIPIKIARENEIVKLVSKIIDSMNKGIDTTCIECDLNNIIYSIYSLNSNDIRIIENDLSDSD